MLLKADTGPVLGPLDGPLEGSLFAGKLSEISNIAASSMSDRHRHSKHNESDDKLKRSTSPTDDRDRSRGRKRSYRDYGEIYEYLYSESEDCTVESDAHLCCRGR